MPKIYHENDILRYVLGDVSPKEKREIMDMIISDPRLQELAASLKRSKLLLDNGWEDPDPTSIQIILNHGKSDKSEEKYLEPFA